MQFITQFSHYKIIEFLHFLQMAALQNSLKMQCTFLILTAIAISTATTDNNNNKNNNNKNNNNNNNFIPNRQHQQVALCIHTIVHRYFTKGRTILVSMPSDEQPTAAFFKLWSADHKWSSGSALVVLLD